MLSVHFTRQKETTSSNLMKVRWAGLTGRKTLAILFHLLNRLALSCNSTTVCFYCLCLSHFKKTGSFFKAMHLETSLEVTGTFFAYVWVYTCASCLNNTSSNQAQASPILVT